MTFYASATALLWIWHPNSASSQAIPRSLSGRWVSQGFGSIVDFHNCKPNDNTICGDIKWLWAPNDGAANRRLDVKNPNRTLRSRPLIGIEIIRGFRPISPNVWGNGAIYNPDDGRTYTGTIRLINGTLQLQGCAIGVFCQTQIWRRPDDLINLTKGN